MFSCPYSLSKIRILRFGRLELKTPRWAAQAEPYGDFSDSVSVEALPGLDLDLENSKDLEKPKYLVCLEPFPLPGFSVTEE